MEWLILVAILVVGFITSGLRERRDKKLTFELWDCFDRSPLTPEFTYAGEVGLGYRWVREHSDASTRIDVLTDPNANVGLFDTALPITVTIERPSLPRNLIVSPIRRTGGAVPVYVPAAHAAVLVVSSCGRPLAPNRYTLAESSGNAVAVYRSSQLFRDALAGHRVGETVIRTIASDATLHHGALYWSTRVLPATFVQDPRTPRLIAELTELGQIYSVESPRNHLARLDPDGTSLPGHWHLVAWAIVMGDALGPGEPKIAEDLNDCGDPIARAMARIHTGKLRPRHVEAAARAFEHLATTGPGEAFAIVSDSLTAAIRSAKKPYQRLAFEALLGASGPVSASFALRAFAELESRPPDVPALERSAREALLFSHALSRFHDPWSVTVRQEVERAVTTCAQTVLEKSAGALSLTGEQDPEGRLSLPWDRLT